jgi:integral membrane sensor domain MASE1
LRWPVRSAVSASFALSPGESLNLSYTVINIIEAVIGAMLLRKLLPWYNPLQNLNDWARLASAARLCRHCWAAY